MSSFNQSELGAIQELVSAKHIAAAKYSSYGLQCQDVQIKQMFQTASTQAKNAAQNLIQML